MMTISNPERVRHVKVQNMLPKIPKNIAVDVPQFKKLFHFPKNTNCSSTKNFKLPESNFILENPKKMSLLDQIECLNSFKCEEKKDQSKPNSIFGAYAGKPKCHKEKEKHKNLQYNSVETDITQLQNDYLSKRNSNPQLATGQTINYANKIPNLNSKESNLLPLDLKFQSTRRSTDALEKLKQPVHKIRNFDSLFGYKSEKFLKNFFTKEKMINTQDSTSNENIQKRSLDSKNFSIIKSKYNNNSSLKEINTSFNKFDSPSKVFAESALNMKDSIIAKSLNEQSIISSTTNKNDVKNPEKVKDINIHNIKFNSQLKGSIKSISKSKIKKI